MHSTALLVRQISGVNTLYHQVADDLNEPEWTKRAVAAANPAGFTLWHLPRIQDWAVQTVLRGIPEVLTDPGWHDKGALQTPGNGAGFTGAEVDAIAHGTRRADVVAYADAVHRAVLDWLGTLTDDDLDVVPDMAGHEAGIPAYQRPSFRSEVDDLLGLPTWRFLIGPCSGHARGHLGELETLKSVLRAMDRPA